VTKAGTGGGPRDITNLGLGEDETQGQDILTYQRPPVDVFKAIFASDDEDEDAGSEGRDDDGEEKGEKGKGGFTSATVVLDNDEDPKTFKPKFVPRPRGRDRVAGAEEKQKEKNGKGAKKDKKEKKDKKKDKGKVLVSFEMEEDGGRVEVEGKRSKEDRPAKKRRKDREREGEKKGGGEDENGGEAMQMQIHEPDGLNETTTSPSGGGGASLPNSTQPSIDPGGINRSRKRAVDFMD